MSVKIGFYICHCGINIAYKVRVEEVAAFARELQNVVVARDYKFMCSDPGQAMIEKDIHDFGLNRVVVASCSPRLHAKTFMAACQRAGLNPYYFQMASVREQVSWVTENEDDARFCKKCSTTFTDGGTRNHTEPWAKAAAMSWSPMPCPKALTAPMMLAWLSVDTKVLPGPTRPSSMARWVPIPLSMSRTATPVSRAKVRQSCWLAA